MTQKAINTVSKVRIQETLVSEGVKVYNAAEAAKVVGCSQQTILNYIKAGVISGKKDSSRAKHEWVIEEPIILQFIEKWDADKKGLKEEYKNELRAKKSSGKKHNEVKPIKTKGASTIAKLIESCSETEIALLERAIAIQKEILSEKAKLNDTLYTIKL